MEDVRQKAKSQENFLEKLMGVIPGFKGYKNREQARDSDKIQRKFLAEKLSREKSRLMDVGNALMSSGNISLLGEIDRVSKIVDRVMDKIEHAEYGYAGLFDTVKIGEQELDTAYEYDMGMVYDLESFGEAIDALENAVDSGDPKARLKDCEKSIKTLLEKVLNRKKVMMGVE